MRKSSSEMLNGEHTSQKASCSNRNGTSVPTHALILEIDKTYWFYYINYKNKTQINIKSIWEQKSQSLSTMFNNKCYKFLNIILMTKFVPQNRQLNHTKPIYSTKNNALNTRGNGTVVAVVWSIAVVIIEKWRFWHLQNPVFDAHNSAIHQRAEHDNSVQLKGINVNKKIKKHHVTVVQS